MTGVMLRFQCVDPKQYGSHVSGCTQVEMYSSVRGLILCWTRPAVKLWELALQGRGGRYDDVVVTGVTPTVFPSHEPELLAVVGDCGPCCCE